MAHAPAACVAQLDTALDTAAAALAETRRLVRGQDPAALEHGGLTEALAAQAAESGALGLPTTLAVHGQARRLDTSAGETVLAPPVASRLRDRMRSPENALTTRELEIVARLAQGDSNRDLARALSISEATVKSRLVHIFGKLGVDSRTKVVIEARRRALL
jgi:DNA-binding NarL/FixJ family response regulator